jgi:Flp pilus assembly protein TadD
MKQTKKSFTLFLIIILSYCLLVACTNSNLNKSSSNNDETEVEDILQGAGIKVSSANEAIIKADKAIKAGKTNIAELYYIKAFDLEPNNLQLLQKMTDLYMTLKKYELAEVSLKLMVDKQPNDLEAIEQYGLLLLSLRKYPKARENLSRVVANRQSWRAYNGLGIIENLKEEPLKAEVYFRKADKLLPNSPELLNNIGFSLYKMNKLSAAESFYNKALQINPGFNKSIYNYGLLKAHTRRYEEALQVFSKVASTAEANNNIGYIAMMNGDYKKANFYFEEAIKSSSEYYEKANDNLKQLEVLENKHTDN